MPTHKQTLKNQNSYFSTNTQQRISNLQNEYVTDQIGKYIYEINCTKQLLQIAEEKTEYRRTLKEK